MKAANRLHSVPDLIKILSSTTLLIWTMCATQTHAATSATATPLKTPQLMILRTGLKSELSNAAAERSFLDAAIEVNAAGGNAELVHRAIHHVTRHPVSDETSREVIRSFMKDYGCGECARALIDQLANAPESQKEKLLETLREINGPEISRVLLNSASKMPTPLKAKLHAVVESRKDSALSGSLTADAILPSLSPVYPVLAFQRQKISDRRFEASSAFDVNNDGTTDVVSGGFWYQGPDFAKEHKICDVLESSEYFDDFSDYPMDVNGDGLIDIITGGYFGGPLRWRENPGTGTGDWKEHSIEQVGSIETTRFWDVDGDGFEELCPNASGRIEAFRLTRDETGKPTGTFTRHEFLSAGNNHGLGFGDINGDGRGDFVGPDGWYEAPQDPLNTRNWKAHNEFKLGSASVPIIVLDVNGDSRNDLIVGQGHDYGLHWYEQVYDDTTSPTAPRKWIKHVVEQDRSQYHDMMLADLDNDGTPEIVTGKRFRAHNGNDPGAYDPLGLYYYKLAAGTLKRVAIDYGPADRTSGSGIYLWIEDLDGDGLKDIVAPGKDGLYIFRNLGYGN